MKFMSACLLFVSISLLFGTANAEDINLNELTWNGDVAYYDGNPFTGKAVFYHNDGKKLSEGEFKNGKEHGVRKVYHRNGQINIIDSWINGRRHGWQRLYFPDGKLASEYLWENGKQIQERLY